MRWAGFLVAGLALLVASGARADVQWTDAGTIIADNAFDSMLVTEGGASADSVLEACNQGSTCVTFNATNGGPAGARWVYKVNATSGQQRYYDTPTFAATTSAHLAARVHVPTAPGANRVILRLREDGDGNGTPDADGCGIRLNTDRTLQLVHAGVTVGSASARKMQTQYCSGTACSVDADCVNAGKGLCISGTCHNVERPCTTGTQSTDCPSGQTCATCTAATGAGCYVGDLAVTEVSQGNAVFCTGYLDGEEFGAGTLIPVTIGPVVGARYGANGTEAGALANMTLGSIRWGNDDDPGRGYAVGVGPLGPNITASPTNKYNQWTAQSCGAGAASNHVQCIDDFLVSPYDYASASGDLRTGAKLKNEVFARVSPQPTLRPGETVPLIQLDIAGETSNQAGTRQLQLMLGVCTGVSDFSTCTWDVDPTELTIALNTSPAYWGRHASFEAPVSGATAWAQHLKQLAMRMFTLSTHAENTRAQILAGAIVVRYPDVPLPVTLTDHNVGTDDGIVTIGVNGNSLNGGTFATVCQGGSRDGESCSVDFYCSHIATRDSSCTDDAQCQVCANRQVEFGNVGYPCGPNNGGATCALGSCTGGSCAGDSDVSCVTAGDCDLGLCSGCSTADCTGGGDVPQGQCIEACPDGVCPSDRATPCDELPGHIGAGAIVCFNQGAETNPLYRSTRLVSNLEGRNIEGIASGLSRQVAGAGACSVSTGYNCCTCDSNDDCGTGGTCTSGLCTAGDGMSCAGDADCKRGVGGEYWECQHPPLDYLIQIDEADNDQNVVRGGAPNCDGWGSIPYMKPTATPLTSARDYCDQCNQRLCTTDTTCTTNRSASSECIAGRAVGLSTVVCSDDGWTDFYGAIGRCTIDIDTCNVAADCEPRGGTPTCSGGTAGAGPGMPETGLCVCSASAGSCDTDADCGGGNCVSGTCHTCPVLTINEQSWGYRCTGTPARCRLECSVNADCGTSGSCVGGVCESICTCPTDSSDMPNFPNADACTTDADCPGGSKTLAGINHKWQGRCQGGSCVCGGLATCLDPVDACYQEATEWRAAIIRDGAFGSLVGMSEDIAAQPDGGDGGPRFIVTTLPDVIGEVCNAHRPDTALKHQNNAAILEHFSPWAVDLKGAMAGFDTNVCHPDLIHWAGPCAAAGGGVGTHIAPGIGAYLQAWNTCATNAPGPRQRPQKYCQQANNTWTSTTCSKDDPSQPDKPCPAGQFCRPRPCTVAGDCPAAGDICNTEPA